MRSTYYPGVRTKPGTHYHGWFMYMRYTQGQNEEYLYTIQECVLNQVQVSLYNNTVGSTTTKCAAITQLLLLHVTSTFIVQRSAREAVLPPEIFQTYVEYVHMYIIKYVYIQCIIN